MRRHFAVIALLGAIALTGIGRHQTRPPATPTPAPTPVATPKPALPVLVIYPFQVNGDADKTSGAKLAALFAGQMQAAGGITIKPLAATVGVARADYLTNAIKGGADYYVSGYLTPLGDEVALVEQVVSTSSGAIVWANTAQLLTYGDATTQADSIRSAILGHAGRVEAEFQQQQAQSTPTPGPSNGASTSIGAILGLLHHRGPAPKPSLAPNQKPVRAIVLVGRGQAANALFTSLDRTYRVSRSAVLTQNVANDAHLVCGATSTVTVAAGDVRTTQTKSFPPFTQYVFTLRVYRCDGSPFFTHTASSRSMEDAVDQAVAAFIAAHPSNT